MVFLNFGISITVAHGQGPRKGQDVPRWPLSQAAANLEEGEGGNARAKKS